MGCCVVVIVVIVVLRQRCTRFKYGPRVKSRRHDTTAIPNSRTTPPVFQDTFQTWWQSPQPITCDMRQNIDRRTKQQTKGTKTRTVKSGVQYGCVSTTNVTLLARATGSEKVQV